MKNELIFRTSETSVSTKRIKPVEIDMFFSNQGSTDNEGTTKSNLNGVCA
jgi:hypothetical protein